MDNKQDVLVRIEEKYASMSKSHKAIAGFIKEHYDQAVFMTAAKLGEEGFIFGLPLRHGRGPPFKGDGGLSPVGGMQICLQFGPLALRFKGGYEGAGQSNKYLQAYAFTRQRPQG